MSFETTKTSEDIANTETSSTKENNDLDETKAYFEVADTESAGANNVNNIEVMIVKTIIFVKKNQAKATTNV